jgi:hypothetical protein
MEIKTVSGHEQVLQAESTPKKAQRSVKKPREGNASQNQTRTSKDRDLIFEDDDIAVTKLYLHLVPVDSKKKTLCLFAASPVKTVASLDISSSTYSSLPVRPLLVLPCWLAKRQIGNSTNNPANSSMSNGGAMKIRYMKKRITQIDENRFEKIQRQYSMLGIVDIFKQF